MQYSPLFQEFSKGLAHRLDSRIQLCGKTIVDIGCGKGHFLSTLCELTGAQGIGFDPSYEEGSQPAASNLKFVRDFYSPRYSGHSADLVCCRHVIDILDEPVEFLRGIKGNVQRPRVPVYFESPDATYTFRNAVIWNLVYEHKSWFTPVSYRRMFELAGYEVLDVVRCWNDEYMGLDGLTSSEVAPSTQDAASEVAQVLEDLQYFCSQSQAVLQQWRDRMDDLRRRGLRAAAWGAGARGISWLTLLNPGDLVTTVIDINPRRQGKFLPVSGHEVRPPEALRDSGADVLFITNPTYEHEIREHARALGFGGVIETL